MWQTEILHFLDIQPDQARQDIKNITNIGEQILMDII